jgi:acyl transferase domain-containing protein/NADP-dependent 3-hydroxy acid dehydrogenase YdfG/acyl carrier protein
MTEIKKYNGLEIAVIGMSAQLCSSNDIRSFWDNLQEGSELIKAFTDEELISSGVDEQELQDGTYVRRSGHINHKDQFDNGFFEYRPEEAAFMDPQIRLFHTHCWKAIEDAGYASELHKIKAGVFAGATENINWKLHVYEQAKDSYVDEFYLDKISRHNYLCSLVSHKLNLRGPSVYVDTACSTSLVAIHLACRSLLTRECKIALAGGVSVSTSRQKGYLFREGMVASSDGHCRSFDKDADGTSSGEGVGVVVLKKLQDALTDKDYIYAIIKSSAINNDGNLKVGYTAPSVKGQAECISMAHKLAGIDPSSISYMEAHGTGTRLGDPIEVRALNEAYGTDGTDKYCALGSVKSNIGHLDAAAGVAGFIKTVLSLKNRQLVPSLHYREANPEIDFASGPFYVNTALKIWETKDLKPLRAGVSAFGIGGTNAHVVLEEAPLQSHSEDDRVSKLLVLSARSRESLIRYQEDLMGFLEKEAAVNLSDACYTFQTGRKVFPYKLAIPFKNREELLLKLRTGKEQILKSRDASNSIVFMFSGAGSQYAGMGRGLYVHETVFRTEMDKGLKLLKELTGFDYTGILFPDKEDDHRINDMLHTQPVMFLFEYCLCRLLQSWGIKPRYLIGHSLGEYAAACISGIFSFEDALQLVVRRGELMNKMGAGFMVSIACSEESVRKYLNATVSLAAVNAPEQVVLSGDEASFPALAAQLTSDDVTYVKLYASHAGHSHMIDSILDAYRTELEKVSFHAPEIPIISNLSGNFITTEEATSKEYWLKHMRHTVKFSSGLSQLKKMKEELLYIEIGPGHSLTSLLKQQNTKVRSSGFNMVRHPKEICEDQDYITERLGQLWVHGLVPDWRGYCKGEKRNKLSLPTYNFDPNTFLAEVNPFEGEVNLGALSFSGTHKEKLKDWIYFPVWKSRVLAAGEVQASAKTYLLFSNGDRFCQELKAHLLKENHQVIEVKSGTGYNKASSFDYTIDPSDAHHFNRLVASFKEDKLCVSEVIHCWSMSVAAENLALHPANKEMHQVYFSIVNSVKSLLSINQLSGIHFSFLTNSLHQVLGHEDISYPGSLVLGLLNALPQEYAVSCKNIDVCLTDTSTDLCDLISTELSGRREDRIVALRNGRTWVPDYQRNTSPLINKKSRIKEGGTYLITGGLGQVGFVLARYLLETYRVRVILTGRRSLVSADSDQELQQRFQQLKNISKDVYYYAADVADRHSFGACVLEIETTKGRIDGVIHAAGIIDIDYFEIAEHATLEHVLGMFAPKVQGIQNIYEQFKSKNLDFVWVTSGTASIIGEITFGAYSAANAFLNYFIASKANELPNWKSMNLSRIEFDPDRNKVSEPNDKNSLNPGELAELFEWSLADEKNPLVYVSFADIATEIQRSLIKKDKYIGTNLTFIHKKTERPDLSSSFVAPETPIEIKLIEMLEDFLGIENIGVEDNFFELGGDSLKAMVLLKRIKKEYTLTLSLKEFFRFANIRQLALEIEQILWLKEGAEMKNEITI